MMILLFEQNDPSYSEMLVSLGGRPVWMNGLDDRAACALLKDGWTMEKLRAAVAQGRGLTQIPNVSPKVEAHIIEWLAGENQGDCYA
ncbi:MAG: hypothetical protein M0Q49_01500 [Porticoccaceae bacterium]|nr:hypothetical protein [Porticoccaceae bacterium]